MSAGCEVGYEEDSSPYPISSEGITHQIIDRSISAENMLANREYVQPQWVFDCLNHFDQPFPLQFAAHMFPDYLPHSIQAFYALNLQRQAFIPDIMMLRGRLLVLAKWMLYE